MNLKQHTPNKYHLFVYSYPPSNTAAEGKAAEVIVTITEVFVGGTCDKELGVKVIPTVIGTGTVLVVAEIVSTVIEDGDDDKVGPCDELKGSVIKVIIAVGDSVTVLVVEVVLTIIEDGNDDKLGLFDKELDVKVALGVGDVSVLTNDDVVSDGMVITTVVEVSDGLK